MDRRQLLKNPGVVLGASGYAEAAGRALAQDQRATQSNNASAKVGRPVRAVSIGFKQGLPLEQIVELVDKEGMRGADIIALPEHCRGMNDRSQEGLDGPTITAVSALASKHRTYVVCPIDRIDGDRRFNSAVLLDRRGKVAAIYDKLYPYWSEFTSTPSVLPGESVTVFPADFGRVGFATCFDVNWAPLWQRLGDFGAELIIWPSAYSAGRSLQAHAADHNYYIMSSSRVPDCLVYDIDGERLLYEHSNVVDNINVSRFTFDLDRCVFHYDFNLPTKLANLLKDHGAGVVREKSDTLEKWFVLKAKQPGVSARELARKYGLEERRPYINRSRSEIDKMRGWQFS
ncbi:MAG: carbon-nitrogen hydrolase family protein [Bryobacteraceae bacterium]|jgi:predicted amidohydrolase